MADAPVTKASVSATVQQIVAKQVQEVLNQKVVVPGTVLEQQVGPGIDTLKVPRIGKFTVNTKTAGAPVDAQTNTATTDDLALNQYKVIQFLIEDIAGLQSNIDIMGQYLAQAGADLAVEMDNYLISQLELASAAAPDNRRAFSAGTSLTKADILLARQLLNEQNVPQDDRFALIDPANESAILSISEFTRVNESGSASGLRNGEFGKLFGFTFMISTGVNAARQMFYHRSHLSMGRQLLPKTEYFRDMPNLSDRWGISHIYGAKVMDTGKRAVKIGEAT